MLTSAKKIEMALAYKGLKSADLARLLDTSPQNLNQIMKRNKFTQESLEKIAEVLGAEYVCYFKFPDGYTIGK